MGDTFRYFGTKKLRTGYTTGTCAAAASAGAVQMLLSQLKINVVKILLPNEITADLSLLDIQLSEEECICAVKKDSGDDPDITNHILIYAKVSKIEDKDIIIDGGKGIGRVTKKGLPVLVGEAAINPVPREMIRKNVQRIMEQYHYEKGFRIEIFAPNGENIAKKTFNEQLGIINGISILGTTGIVEPMSERALIESIASEIRVLIAEGEKDLLIVPGNYGESFCKKENILPNRTPVKCSNYVGETINHAIIEGAESILFVSHIGKFIKIAEGMMNTHSQYGDARIAIFVYHAVKQQIHSNIIFQLCDSNTTEEAVDILNREGYLHVVMRSIMQSIEVQLNRKSQDMIKIAAIVFSNEHGILGKTSNADEIIKKMIRGKA